MNFRVKVNSSMNVAVSTNNLQYWHELNILRMSNKFYGHAILILLMKNLTVMDAHQIALKLVLFYAVTVSINLRKQVFHPYIIKTSKLYLIDFDVFSNR